MSQISLILHTPTWLVRIRGYLLIIFFFASGLKIGLWKLGFPKVSSSAYVCIYANKWILRRQIASDTFPFPNVYRVAPVIWLNFQFVYTFRIYARSARGNLMFWHFHKYVKRYSNFLLLDWIARCWKLCALHWHLIGWK